MYVMYAMYVRLSVCLSLLVFVVLSFFSKSTTYGYMSRSITYRHDVSLVAAGTGSNGVEDDAESLQSLPIHTAIRVSNHLVAEGSLEGHCAILAEACLRVVARQDCHVGARHTQQAWGGWLWTD
jgi:hypothetical protein